MNKNYIQYKKFLYSTRGWRFMVLFLAFFVLFGILGVTITNTYDQTEQKNKQLSVLEDDVKREKEKNLELQKQKEYYKSDIFIEKEARSTLGLSYPNEDIYILKKNAVTPLPNASQSANSQSTKTKEKSVFEKWLDLVFG